MTAQWESALAVVGYGDFEETSHAVRDAMAAAYRELREYGFRRFKVIDADFIEFDSSNMSHACAYFDCTIEGVEQDALNAKLEED